MTETTKWWVLASTVAAGVLLYLLAPVITPFLTAALLAYLGDPLVDRLEHYKLPRTVAVICVFIVIFLIVAIWPFVLIPVIEQQITWLTGNIPNYIDWVQQHVVPWLSQSLNVDPQLLDATAMKKAIAENWGQVGSIASYVMSTISQSSLVLIAWVANIVLIPVVTFYLLRDWDHLVARINQLLPRKQQPTISRLARESDEVLGAFLRGQLLVMICLGTIYTLGLWIMGLDVALLVGMIAGLVSFVPYLGFIVGIVLAGIAAIMQFHDIYYLLPVAVVFGIGQALEGMLLTPLLVGDKIGLHPVAVIFAIMAGGQLFGFVGILLALPIAAVIMVIVRYIHGRYTDSSIYNAE